MDQIADLVIDLSIDTADFKEQLPRVKNLLNGTAREAERAEARMKRFEESQKQAASATVIQTQAVVKHAQGHVSLAEDVERARLRMEALSRQMREEQVQAAALAAAQDKMAAAFYRQIDSVKQASAGLQELQRIQQQIRQARNSGGIAQQDYLALISEVTAKTRVLTQAEETATRQKTAFIRQLKEQTSRQKMTTTELLRAKAAQLGCSSAAEVYIRKMEKAGNTTHSLGLKSAAARRELGVMIGELARGNFGALRGSGITLANRAGWIDKLMTPKGLAVGGVIGGITAAVIGLGKAWMEGQEEGEAFNRQLELTGHYAGVTAGQLWALSENLSGNGITQHAMAGSLAQVVGSGAFHGNDIGMVAKAAAQMERSVGQSVSDTISQFKRLKDDPVSAAKALDDELHFLTATQLEQIRVLGEQGRTSDAARIWNGQTLTFVQDRPSDKVWTYNRSNVVMPDDGAPFRYSFSALKDRHNAVEVNWIDPNNGWETATALVEDTQAIARYGRNVTKMDAFGCTSRGQAHRAGLWLIKTELLETQTVDFSVGAEGLRHVPGDVIEICDDDYAGISTGGRVLAVNSQTRTLTLDREITLPSSGTTLISLVDGSGNPVSVEVQSVTDGVKVKVSRVPDGVAGYSVWGLKLPTLRQRLFRCVSIRENDDGTYAITAVQHVPEKEAIVDNGAHFDGDQSGTVNGVTPPAVQHLTAEVTADSGEYQVLARWDTPKVVKGVSFMLRLTVAADDGSERLVSTARTTETTYRFRQLALGRYTLTVRAVNARGQQGDPASVSFRIAAPAAPSRIELTPGYFQITATPHLAVYDPTVQFEFWFSETRITDIRQVETTARYLGTGLYWIAASINIKPGHDYYFYIRSVNTVGKSAFVEAVGRASDDAEGYLDFFKGKITESHLGKELLEKVDLTEDNASRLDEFSKEWKDANDKWNAMWGVKIEQTKDGKHYVAGIGLSMEDTEEGKLSQFLVAANRIAFIDPANGNETPMFVAQGNQIFMNDVFLKRLTAPTITSGGSPPVFSLTSDGKLTAKNADISGSVNANSGTLNNVTINQNCTIKGMLEATQVRGDFVKAVSKAFPKKVGTWGNTETPNGTVTVTISDDHNFDRQIIIPPIIFNGIAYDDPGSGNNPGGTRYTGYGFEVRKNGVLIASRETKGAIPGSYSAVIDMPSGGGSVTLEFKVFQKGNQGAGNITDCTVIVTKKAASGISIR